MVNDGAVKELMAGIGVGCFEFVRLLLFKGTNLPEANNVSRVGPTCYEGYNIRGKYTPNHKP